MLIRESIPRFLFIAFSMEVILMGPGGWLLLAGTPLRKFIFVFLFLSLVTNALLSSRKIIIQDAITVCGFILFFTCWGVMIPVIYGRDLAMSFADYSPLLGLCIIPLLATIYNNNAYWERDKKYITLALNLLALLHVVVWIFGLISTDFGNAAVLAMRNVFEPGVDELDSSIFVGYTIDDSFRVQWGPSVFLLVGLYFAIDNIKNKGINWATLSIFVLQVTATASTQSRGFWMAIVISLAVYFGGISFFPKRKSRFNISLCVLLLFLLTFILIPFYSPEFLESIGLSREGSDDLRMEQVRPLLDKLANFPIFGIGFGGGVDLIRSASAPYAYEVSILALYMKLGILGSICAFILSYLLTQFAVKNGTFNRLNRAKITMIYATMVGFIFASNTNPYLSNFFGMLIIVICLIELGSAIRISPRILNNDR
jgi:hypothetical protein